MADNTLLRLNELQTRISDTEKAIALNANDIVHIKETFKNELDSIDGKLDVISGQLEKVHSSMWKIYLIIGAISASLGTTGGGIGHKIMELLSQ